MASKIHTKDPKHHKYTCVNKRERKKQPKRLIRLLSLLVLHKAYEFVDDWWNRTFNWRDIAANADNMPRTKVIYDDCNHKSFRVKRKTKDGWFFVCENTRTRRRDYYYDPSSHIKRYRKTILLRNSENAVHFKR